MKRALSFAMLVCALSTPASAEKAVSADVNLIKRLGLDAYRDEPFDAPYIALFERGRKRLIFVSGDHASGIDTAVTKTIRHAFKKHAPQAVVVEGLASGGEDDDSDERLRQAKAFAAEAPGEFPENYYPLYLADRRGIPFVGGEPALETRLQALEARGYAAEDLWGLGLGANIGAGEKECSPSRAVCAELHERMAKELAAALGLKGRRGYAEFERWYARRAGLKKPAHRLTSEDNRPLGGPEATFLQTMAFHLELVRESSIVSQIERMLNAHDRVLVVYGSGHLVRQRPVWEKALGPSRDLKPF